DPDRAAAGLVAVGVVDEGSRDPLTVPRAGQVAVSIVLVGRHHGVGIVGRIAPRQAIGLVVLDGLGDFALVVVLQERGVAGSIGGAEQVAGSGVEYRCCSIADRVSHGQRVA